VNLSGSKSRLVGVTKELSSQWDQVKNYWRDAKALEFEHKYIEELLINMDKTVTVIEKLDDLIRKVRSDCE
jgi:hypothetical protein